MDVSSDVGFRRVPNATAEERSPPSPRDTVGADQQVVEDGERRKQSRVLKGSGDSDLGDLIGAKAGDVTVLEDDASPFVGTQHASQDIEERRLAGAVGPDDAGDEAFFELKVEPLDGRDALEVLGDVVGTEQHQRSNSGSGP